MGKKRPRSNAGGKPVRSVYKKPKKVLKVDYYMAVSYLICNNKS